MSNRITFSLFVLAMAGLHASAGAQQQPASPGTQRPSAAAIQAVIPGPLAAPAASSGMPASTGIASSPATRAAGPATSPAPRADVPAIAPAVSSAASGTGAQPSGAALGTNAALVPSNPFNGAPLSNEQLQRELDLSRAQTRALEDKLLQSLPPEQAKALQARREQEASKGAKPEGAAKASAKNDKTEGATSASRKPEAAVSASAPAKKVAAKPKRRAAPVKEVFENDLAQGEDPGRPTLVSIVAVGARYSVIFEVDGRTFTALDGELTPFGRLTVWDESCIDLGETRLRLVGARMR